MENYVGQYLVVTHSRPDRFYTTNHEIISVSENSFVVEVAGKEVTVNCDIKQYTKDPILRTNESYLAVEELFNNSGNCTAWVKEQKDKTPSKVWELE